MLDRVYSLINCSVRLTASQYFCEDNFEGGGWALVRRVRQGTTWHPATDNLQGTAVYGSAGTSTSDSTFSLPFASLITSSETLFLLANGMEQGRAVVCCMHEDFFGCHKTFLFLAIAGDRSMWLIAPYSSISNGGQAYDGLARPVLKSSASSSPSMLQLRIFFWFNCFYHSIFINIVIYFLLELFSYHLESVNFFDSLSVSNALIFGVLQSVLLCLFHVSITLLALHVVNYSSVCGITFFIIHWFRDSLTSLVHAQ